MTEDLLASRPGGYEGINVARINVARIAAMHPMLGSVAGVDSAVPSRLTFTVFLPKAMRWGQRTLHRSASLAQIRILVGLDVTLLGELLEELLLFLEDLVLVVPAFVGGLLGNVVDAHEIDQDVHLAAAVQGVVPTRAEDGVLAFAAVQRIVVVAAVDSIISVAAEHGVVAG